jgi:hypothetical protein
VNVDANADGDDPLLFRRASQNLAAAAMLLHDCPEAVTSKERRVRQQLKALLEAAGAKQAESLQSRQWSERDRVAAGAAPSAHGPDTPGHPHPGIRTVEKGPGRRCRQSRVGSVPTAMPGTPSRLADRLGVSTTTATTTTAATTTVHATTTTEGADDAMTVTTIVTAELVAKPEGSPSFWPECAGCEVPITFPSPDQCP